MYIITKSIHHQNFKLQINELCFLITDIMARHTLTRSYSDHFQEISLEDQGIQETSKHVFSDKGNARKSIIPITKFSHSTGGGGGNAGGIGGTANNGDNGRSGSSSTQGGTAVIPVYAAGAANNHHQKVHHSPGSCNQNSVGVSVITLLPLFIQLYI